MDRQGLKFFILRVVTAALVAFAGVLATGCVTVAEIMADEPAAEAAKVVTMTHYKLRSGMTAPNPNPYPSFTPVFIQFYYSNGAMVEKLAFKKWDFDRDGRPEMVEVMSDEGKVYSTMMDFNGDGNVDVTKTWNGQPGKW